MKDTLSNKKEVKTDEEQNRVREEQYSIIKALFLEASNITEETPQREICSLLSKTSNYIFRGKNYISEVCKLHLKLSDCLKSKYNEHPSGFADLSEFISESKFLD